jgi:hypothetical protein
MVVLPDALAPIIVPNFRSLRPSLGSIKYNSERFSKPDLASNDSVILSLIEQ